MAGPRVVRRRRTYRGAGRLGDRLPSESGGCLSTRARRDTWHAYSSAGVRVPPEKKPLFLSPISFWGQQKEMGRGPGRSPDFFHLHTLALTSVTALSKNSHPRHFVNNGPNFSLLSWKANSVFFFFNDKKAFP